MTLKSPDDSKVVEFDQVSKRFGGILALDQVSLTIARGEIHAVVGENGAGKSTLMKILAGVHEPDAGRIWLEGRSVRLRSAGDARRQGISIVFQELNLFPHRSVAANIFAHREITGALGWINLRAMRDAARQALSQLNLTLSPDRLVGTLSLGEKQFVEIARALAQRARIIILDEPNSSLNETESQRLFEVLRGLRAQGVALIYVSHRLEQVFAIADRITVLRDGRQLGTFSVAQSSIPHIIELMVGQPLDHLFPRRSESVPPGPMVLQVRDLRGSSRLGPVSFNARAGEIVGFAGLDGSGVEETFRVLFGLTAMSQGEIRVRDRCQHPASPLAAMRRGWALVPSSRREHGLMMNWSIARNSTLLVLGRLLNRLGFIDSGATRRMASQSAQRLGLNVANVETQVASLSGGNQQKVLIGKWLATDPSILLLNDPTRGVDVAAKREIYEICHRLALQGMTVLLTSSEVEEVLGLADRIYVFVKGRITREYHQNDVTKASLLHAMSGVTPDDESVSNMQE